MEQIATKSLLYCLISSFITLVAKIIYPIFYFISLFLLNRVIKLRFVELKLSGILKGYFCSSRKLQPNRRIIKRKDFIY